MLYAAEMAIRRQYRRLQAAAERALAPMALVAAAGRFRATSFAYYQVGEFYRIVLPGIDEHRRHQVPTDATMIMAADKAGEPARYSPGLDAWHTTQRGSSLIITLFANDKHYERDVGFAASREAKTTAHLCHHDIDDIQRLQGVGLRRRQ